MGAQTARALLFPATCERCGGRFSERVNFCPRCGTRTLRAPDERVPAKKPDIAARIGLWGSRSKSPSESAGPGADARSPAAPVRAAARRGWKAGIALMLLTLLAVAVILMLSHPRDDSGGPDRQGASTIVQGSVTADGASPRLHGAAAPAAGDLTATAQRNTVASMGASESAPSAAATTQNSPSPPSLSEREPIPSFEPAGSARTGSSKNQRLMTLALARARTGLEKNDLRMARSGVYWALSLEHDNSEALMLKQQLLSRERGRASPSDAAPGSATGAGAD
jgi:ribosomal protein L40E